MSIVTSQSGSVPCTYSSTRYQPNQALAPSTTVPEIRNRAEVDVVKFLADPAVTSFSASNNAYYTPRTDRSAAINLGMNKHVCVNQNEFSSEKFVITSEFIQTDASANNQLSQSPNVGVIDTPTGSAAGVASISKNITSTGSVPMYDSSYLVKIDAGSHIIDANLNNPQSGDPTDSYKVNVDLPNNSEDIKNRFKALCNPKNINNNGALSNSEPVIGAFIQESPDNSNTTLVNTDNIYIHRDTATNKIISNQTGGNHNSADHYNYVITPNPGLPGLLTGSYRLNYESVNANISVTNDNVTNGATTSLVNNLPFGVHSAEPLTSESILNGTLLTNANIELLTDDYFSDAKTEIRYGFEMNVEVNSATNPGYQGKTVALGNVGAGETDSSEVFTLNNDTLVNNDKYMKAIWDNGANDYIHKIVVNNGDVVLNPVSPNDIITVQRQTEYLPLYDSSNNGLVQVFNRATNNRVDERNSTVPGFSTNIFYQNTDLNYTSAVGVLNQQHLTTEFINYDVSAKYIKPSELVLGSDCLGKSGNSALIKRAFDANNYVMNDTLTNSLFTFTEGSYVGNNLNDNEIQWVDLEVAMDMLDDGLVKEFNSVNNTTTALPTDYFESNSVIATNIDLSLTNNDIRLISSNKTKEDLPSLSNNWSWQYLDSNNQYLYTTKSSLGVTNITDHSALKEWLTGYSTQIDSIKNNQSITFNFALKVFNVDSSVGVKNQTDIFSYHVSLLVTSTIPNSNPVKVELNLSSPTGTNGNDYEYTYSNFNVPIMIGNYNNLQIQVPSFTLRKVTTSGGNVDIVFSDNQTHNGPTSTVNFKYYDFYTMISKFQQRVVTSTEGGSTTWDDIVLNNNDSENSQTGLDSEGLLNDNISFYLDVNYGFPSVLRLIDLGEAAKIEVSLNFNNKVVDINNNYKKKQFLLDLKMGHVDGSTIITATGKKYQSNADVLALFDQTQFQYELPSGGVALNYTTTFQANGDTVTVNVMNGSDTLYTIVSTRNLLQQLRIISQKQVAFRVIESLDSVPFGETQTQTMIINDMAVFGNSNNQINLNSSQNLYATKVSGVLITYPSTIACDDNYSFDLLADEVKVALHYTSSNLASGVSNYSSKQFLSSVTNTGLVAYDRDSNGTDLARSVTFARWRNNNSSRTGPTSANSSNVDNFVGAVDYILVRTISTVTFKVSPVSSGTEYSYVISDYAQMYLNNYKTDIPAGTLGNLGLKLTYNCSMISNASGPRIYTLDVNPDTYTVTYSSTSGSSPARSDGLYSLSNKFQTSTGNLKANYHMHSMPSIVSSPNEVLSRRVYVSNGQSSAKYTIKIDTEGTLKIYRVATLEQPQLGNYTDPADFVKSETTLDAGFDMNGFHISTNISDGLSTFRYIDTVSYIQTFHPQIRLVYPDVRAITTLPYEVKYPGAQGANYKEWYVETGDLEDNTNGSGIIIALPDSGNVAGSVNSSSAVNIKINHIGTKTLAQYLQDSRPSLRYPLRPETNKLTLKLYYSLVNTAADNSSLLVDTLFNEYYLAGDDLTASVTKSKSINVSYNSTSAVYNISYVQFNDNTYNIFSNNSALNPNDSTNYNVFFTLDNPYLMPGSYWIKHDVSEGLVFNIYGSRYVNDSNGVNLVIEKHTTSTLFVGNIRNLAAISGLGNYENTLSTLLSNSSPSTNDYDNNPSITNNSWNPTALQNANTQRLSLIPSSKKKVIFNFNNTASVQITNAEYNNANTYNSEPAINFNTSSTKLSNWIKANVTQAYLASNSGWQNDTVSGDFDFSISPLSNYGSQIVVQAIATVSPLQPFSVLSVYQPDIYKFVSADKVPVFRIKYNGSLMAVRMSSRVIELASNTTNDTYEQDFIVGNILDC